MPLHDLNIPPTVYLVADHLDAALAAGEDLVAVGRNWPVGDAADPGVAGARRFALSRIRFHEMALLTRIVQGAEQIRMLSSVDPMFRPLAQLFLATTRDLVASVREPQADSDLQFDTGDGVIAYLRARGLIDEEAPGLSSEGDINLGDPFQVAGLVPLGVVLDLVAEFLEALEAAYELYPACERAKAAETVAGIATASANLDTSVMVGERANDAA